MSLFQLNALKQHIVAFLYRLRHQKIFFSLFIQRNFRFPPKVVLIILNTESTKAKMSGKTFHQILCDDRSTCIQNYSTWVGIVKQKLTNTFSTQYKGEVQKQWQAGHVNNGPSAASSSFIFGLFKQTSIQFLQQINVEKCTSSKWCWDLNPQPSDCKSHPITSRPGLLPNKRPMLQRRLYLLTDLTDAIDLKHGPLLEIEKRTLEWTTLKSYKCSLIGYCNGSIVLTGQDLQLLQLQSHSLRSESIYKIGRSALMQPSSLHEPMILCYLSNKCLK